MRIQAEKLIALILLSALMLSFGTDVYANVSVTLPDTESTLQKTIDKVLSLMLISGSGTSGEFNKQYVDYYGGYTYFNDTVTVLTTDNDGKLIKQLENEPNIEIKKVPYSLNQLNSLAAKIELLGKSGKIKGYLNTPVVNVRENNVVLKLYTDRGSASGLSSDELRKEVDADKAILSINYMENYQTSGSAEVEIPKTGDKPSFATVILLMAAVGLLLFRKALLLHGYSRNSGAGILVAGENINP